MEAVEPTVTAPNAKGYLIVWGNNQHHQLGACLSIERQIAKEKVLPKNVKPIQVHKDKVGVPPTLIGPDALGAGVKFPSISNVACGEYHTLAVAQDGTLWSWGLNTDGQLGHGITKAGDFKSHPMPRRVQGLEKKIVIKAAAGGQFSVVLTESNKVRIRPALCGCAPPPRPALCALLCPPRTRDVLRRAARPCDPASTPPACAARCGLPMRAAEQLAGACVPACVRDIGRPCAQVYAWGSNKFGQLGTGTKELKNR